MKKNIFIVIVLCFCSAVTISMFTGCKKTPLAYTTTSDVNIVDYLRLYPQKYSEFVKILDRTNISPFLNAYGAYTVFAPTNSAIKLYLQKIGKSSTDLLDTASLAKICKFHLISDTITTGAFTDGKLPSPTMYNGQYLITGVSQSGSTVINRQATLTQSNILTGNGYIHEIDHVLEPPTLTIAQTIEANANYSIFTQVLKATGFYDTLNIANNPDTTRKFLTCFAEPDSVFAKQNINSYADMFARYSTMKNPRDTTDSLYLFAAYHVLPALKYVADIVSTQSHLTLAPQSVLTVVLSGQAVYLNQVTFNGVFEQGVLLNRFNSDISCTNGVFHILSEQLILKTRTPYRVDFDPGDQPEIRKLTSIFRRAGKSQTFKYGQLKYVNWQATSLTFSYYTEASTTSNYYWFDDGVSFNLRAKFNSWIEFTTPLIVKGKYKLWCNFRRASMGQYIQVSVDGKDLPNIVDFATSRPSGTPDVLLSKPVPYKIYTVNQTQKNNFGMCAGNIDIPTTDRHVIRLTSIKDQGTGTGNSVTLDFFQFIPVNEESQIRPLYNRDGSIVP